jgi:Zn-finger nucleic acid-binding protein
MRCPSCNLDLDERERDGTESAYCPYCDVVWVNDNESEFDTHMSSYLDAEWNPDARENESAQPS